MRALLSRMFRRDVGARWYVFAVGYIGAIELTAAATWFAREPHRVKLEGRAIADSCCTG